MKGIQKTGREKHVPFLYFLIGGLYNDFSYAATEDLYRSLPDRTTEEEPGHIFILNEDALPAGRTGAGNEGIATKKHWEVLWCRGDW